MRMADNNDLGQHYLTVAMESVLLSPVTNSVCLTAPSSHTIQVGNIDKTSIPALIARMHQQ
jgi:hypothetical protein